MECNLHVHINETYDCSCTKSEKRKVNSVLVCLEVPCKMLCGNVTVVIENWLTNVSTEIALSSLRKVIEQVNIRVTRKWFPNVRNISIIAAVEYCLQVPATFESTRTDVCYRSRESDELNGIALEERTASNSRDFVIHDDIDKILASVERIRCDFPGFSVKCDLF